MNTAQDMVFQVIRRFFNEQGYAHFHDTLVANLAKAVVDTVDQFNKASMPAEPAEPAAAPAEEAK